MGFATEKLLAEAAYERLKSRAAEAPPSVIARLAPLAPQALAELARRVALSRPQLLRTTYTGTVSGGLIDTSLLTQTSGSPLIEALPRAEVTSVDSAYAWEWVPDLTHLRLEGGHSLVYFTNRGSVLESTAADGTATLRAVRLPTVSSVPRELDSELIDILLGVEAQS